MFSNQEGCLWVWGPSYREGRDELQRPLQSSLSHLPSPLSPQLPLHYLLTPQGLVDSESPVVVHGEQDGFACVVEARGSSHVHSPLPGGHDRRDCVPCRRRKQAGVWPHTLSRPCQGPRVSQRRECSGQAGQVP